MTRSMPKGWRRIFHRKLPQPYRYANSYRGIDRAKRGGYRQIDLDCLITKDGIPVITHWPNFHRDKFDPEGRYRKGARIADLTWRQVRALRSKDGYAIRSAEQMFRYAKRRGIVVCLEVKGDGRFEQSRVWRHLRAARERSGAEVRVMTLQNVGRPGASARRLAQAKAHGFPTILLARGRRPGDWASNWAPHVDYLRGRWR